MNPANLQRNRHTNFYTLQLRHSVHIKRNILRIKIVAEFTHVCGLIIYFAKVTWRYLHFYLFLFLKAMSKILGSKRFMAKGYTVLWAGPRIAIGICGVHNRLIYCVIFIVCIYIIYKCGRGPRNAHWRAA